MLIKCILHFPCWPPVTSGLCDVDIAGCWCPPGTRYEHKPAPKGSRYGTPPLKVGRPMMECTPSTGPKVSNPRNLA